MPILTSWQVLDTLESQVCKLRTWVKLKKFEYESVAGHIGCHSNLILLSSYKLLITLLYPG